MSGRPKRSLTLKVKQSLSNSVNQYSIVIFLKNGIEPGIEEICRRVAKKVRVIDFNLIKLETTKYICQKNNVTGVDLGFKNRELPKSNYLMLVMNERNGRISGMTFGDIYLNEIYSKFNVNIAGFNESVGVYVDVFCGHDIITGSGSLLMRSLKYLTNYIYDANRVKTKLILFSVRTQSTQEFYQYQGILAVHHANGDPVLDGFGYDALHLRAWDVSAGLPSAPNKTHIKGQSKAPNFILVDRSSEESLDSEKLTKLMAQTLESQSQGSKLNIHATPKQIKAKGSRLTRFLNRQARTSPKMAQIQPAAPPIQGLPVNYLQVPSSSSSSAQQIQASAAAQPPIQGLPVNYLPVPSSSSSSAEQIQASAAAQPPIQGLPVNYLPVPEQIQASAAAQPPIQGLPDAIYRQPHLHKYHGIKSARRRKPARTPAIPANNPIQVVPANNTRMYRDDIRETRRKIHKIDLVQMMSDARRRAEASAARHPSDFGRSRVRTKPENMQQLRDLGFSSSSSSHSEGIHQPEVIKIPSSSSPIIDLTKSD